MSRELHTSGGKLVLVSHAEPKPLAAMFWNCDKVLLLLEVMHLAKVKSDLITAAMRERPLVSLAVVVRQRQT